MRKAIKTAIPTKNRFSIILITIIALLWILSALFLSSFSQGRSVFLAFIGIIWFLSQLITKCNRLHFVNILLIIGVFPFNLTFQIPENIFAFDPYVNGVYINFLHPTLSILDISILIFIFFYIGSFLKNINKKIIITVCVLLVTFIINNLYFYDFNVFFNSGRLLLYTLGGIFFSSFLKEKKLNNTQNVIYQKIVDNLIITLIFIQGIVGIIQFVDGRSLGLEIF